MTALARLFDLTGRIAVVTGGSAGLGLQMATGLAEAGASIVICSRSRERCEQAARAIRETGVEVMAQGCDVSNAAEVKALKEAVMTRFGRVDILVNNAGRTWWAPPEETPLDKWQYVIDLNVTGTFLCAQAFGREMIRQKGGRIINIASDAASFITGAILPVDGGVTAW